MKALLVALNARYIHSSPAPRLLAAACESRGLNAEPLEAEASAPMDKTLRAIAQRGPDVVGFSCYVWNIEAVARLTRALKRVLPGVYIVWGGPEVSFDAPDRLLSCAELDAVVCGEGEQVFPALLGRLERGETPEGQGVCTRASDGGAAPPVPPEAWPELYPPGEAVDPHRLWYAETSRGCPFACGYCVSAAARGVRALPAEESVRRLLAARDAGARTVKLLDRTFNFDAARARAIWKALMERGGGATYHFEIAAHLLGEEDVRLLASAPRGLFQMEFGVQSTSPEALRRAGRAQDWGRLSGAVRALAEAGNIHLHAGLIAGLPGDTAQTFATALDDTLALGAHNVQLGFLKLLPGTPTRSRAADDGVLFSPDPPYEVLSTPGMAYAELCALKDVEAVLSLYVNSGKYPATAARFLRTHASLSAVAALLRSSGFFDVSRGREAREDALRRALLALCDPAEVNECLSQDLAHPFNGGAFHA